MGIRIKGTAKGHNLVDTVDRAVAKATPQDSDTLALVINDLRTVIMAEGLDPLGATEREIGISQAVVIIARAIQAGEVGRFR